MNRLLPSPEKIDTRLLGAGMKGRWVIDKRYGVFAPLWVTAILLTVAAWLIRYPGKRPLDSSTEKQLLSVTRQSQTSSNSSHPVDADRTTNATSNLNRP